MVPELFVGMLGLLLNAAIIFVKQSMRTLKNLRIDKKQVEYNLLYAGKKSLKYTWCQP